MPESLKDELEAQAYHGSLMPAICYHRLVLYQIMLLFSLHVIRNNKPTNPQTHHPHRHSSLPKRKGICIWVKTSTEIGHRSTNNNGWFQVCFFLFSRNPIPAPDTKTFQALQAGPKAAKHSTWDMSDKMLRPTEIEGNLSIHKLHCSLQSLRRGKNHDYSSTSLPLQYTTTRGLGRMLCAECSIGATGGEENDLSCFLVLEDLLRPRVPKEEIFCSAQINHRIDGPD